VVALPSLSIVLPVHNAEKTLAVKVAQLLDILPDLTTDFEILLINDGSTDHTDEVAYEIAREYPQVHVTRHEKRLGQRGAIETGLAETSGEILFVQDEQAVIDSSKLHRLWELRNEDDFVFVPSSRLQRPALNRLAAWGVRLDDGDSSSGVQMIRRNTPVQPESIAETIFRHSRTDRPESQRTPLSKSDHRVSRNTRKSKS
jgi:glycosyltransferase involved in cell wall biosynthesis